MAADLMRKSNIQSCNGIILIWNESVPIQLARCWFHRPAISNAKIKYIFQTKYTKCTEAILSNNTLKLIWFEITKMLITQLKKNKFIVLLIIIFGTLSFPI